MSTVHLMDLNGIVFRFSARDLPGVADGYLTIMEAEDVLSDKDGNPVGSTPAKSMMRYVREQDINKLEDWIKSIKFAQALREAAKT